MERVENLIPETAWRRAYRDIVDFERNIADDGTLIIKFFLHISKAEQRKRFESLAKDPLTAWHVSSEDRDHHRNYDVWLNAYEEALEYTDTEWGPWTIVEATDRRHTRMKIISTIVQALEERMGISPDDYTAPIGQLVAAGDNAESEIPASEIAQAAQPQSEDYGGS